MGIAFRRLAHLIALAATMASCTPQPIVKTRDQIMGECIVEAIKAAPGATYDLSPPADRLVQACMQANNLRIADLYIEGSNKTLPPPPGCNAKWDMPGQAACYVRADQPYNPYSATGTNTSN